MSDSDELGQRVEVEEARLIVARHGAMVIDIRGEDDFAQERIFGSERCDPDDVEARLREASEDEGEDRDTVLLVCGDGSRSGELADQLREGDLTVSSIEGGFDAWTDEHFPTAPGRDEEYVGPKLPIPGAQDSGGEEDEGKTEDIDEPENSGERRPSSG
ncbi:MAG: rhodanese-like domain-containing protein [Solirubrobacterales bacterium]|nr:rhodanese-like domain-containing protein [Solirubrobacterales bacterium]